ncbi:MAG: hypothetical protein ACXV5L_00895 [Thermoanaerobaculia bacterium]
MHSRNAALAITACFAVLLAVTTALHIDISAARDLDCDSVFRDAGRCAGERFLDPSPFAIWLPSDWFVWDSLRSGHLPVWERLQGGGYSPLLTVYNGVFHPVRWLSALFSRDTAPTAIIVLALWAAFLGTVLCAREIGASIGASCVAGFVFTFSSATISFADFSGCLLPVAHLPWIVMFLQRTRRTRGSGDFAAAAITIALLIISGHPSFVFCAIVAVAAIAVADAITFRSFAPIVITAATGMAGCLISTFAIFPSLIGRDELWSYKTQTYSGSSYAILQWPAWFRTVYAAAVLQPYRYIDVDSWIYIGVPVIVLAAIGLYASFRVTQHLGTLAVLFGFLLFAFPGPWMAEVAGLPPVKYLKSWYVMGVVSFLRALAVAIGFDCLLASGRRSKALAIGFALWIIVIDGMHSFRVLAPIRWREPPQTAATRFLRNERGLFRITGLWGQTHTPNSSRITGIEDIRTSQPILLQRYVTWWSIIDHDVRRRSYPTTRITDRLTHPLVASFGIKYVLQSRLRSWLTFHSDPDSATLDRDLSPALASFPLAFRTPFLEVRENPMEIRPRAEFASRVIVVADPRTAERVLAADRTLPLRAVVLESATATRIPAVASGSVALRYPRDSAVSLDVQSATGGLVVLHDTWSRGWRATLDGGDTEVLPVDILSRGVVVPAGRHRIEMRYVPPGFTAGWITSAVAMIALMGPVIWRRGR